MTTHLKKGTHVTWRWGAYEAEGVVAEIFTRRVRRVIKGKAVVRNATQDDPAYLVRQADGNKALKSGSELSAAS